MAVCESDELYRVIRGWRYGSSVWFGAPIMHRMYGLSLAWHWHGFWWHVHWSSHSAIVCSCSWLLMWYALVKVRNLVFLFACIVWEMRCTALLCLAILSPFRYGCSHVDSRWGHVSHLFLWHRVHLAFWCVRGHNMFLLWLPMYWAYMNFNVWVIWLFDNHLSTYGNFFWLKLLLCFHVISL